MSSLRPFASSHGHRALLFLLPLLLIALSACGEKDKNEIAVAQVGDRTISLGYFERKMNNMDAETLPPAIETRAGKEQLLEVMINKEVMAIKAEELGYGEGGESLDAAEGLITYMAVQMMKDELIESLTFVSTEDAQAYYQNLGRILQISYMIHQFEEDAGEARKLVEGGEKWEDVAKRFNAGDPGPTRNWTMELKYGTIADTIEAPVFALETGETTEPLDSVYGYFLIRVEGERADDTLPPFEDIENNVARSVHDRNVNLRTVEVINDVFAEYGYALHENAVRTLYEALPPDAELMPIPPKEEWQSLNLKPADMDTELMRYADDVWTLRRFYDLYEATTILGRPRRDGSLGGLRRFLREMAVRDLMPIAARDRGYFDRQEVLDERKAKREQVMVTALHGELISADVNVTNEMIDEYWAENAHLYTRPELRRGYVLVSSDQAAVRAAYDEAIAGADWSGLVMSYAEASKMSPGSQAGDFGPARRDNSELATPLLWQMEEPGDICEPFQLSEGVWGIGRLEEITPPRPAKLSEVGLQVKRRLESEQSEILFQERVGAWRAEMEITSYPERLDDAVYTPKEEEEVPVEAGHEGHNHGAEGHS